jgi:hypothetical protein
MPNAEVDCLRVHETEQAILICGADLKKVWVPKVEGVSYDPDAKVLTLPEWLAISKELI